MKTHVKLNKNKLHNLITIVFGLIIIILIYFLLINNFNYTLLKEESINNSNNLNSKINVLNNSLTNLTNENNSLKLNLTQMNIEQNDLEQENDTLTNSYSNLKSETESTIKKINEYQSELQTSVDWFQTNSIITQSYLKSRLKINCLDKRSCEINLGCFVLVNNEFNDFKYLDDLKTSSNLDKLQSIEEFVSNKGGDCEDFALLFKAEFNYLKQDCENINLLAVKEKKNSKFWLNYSKTWYWPDTTKVELKGDFANIVCGNIFDLQSGKINGHCVIAFTKKRILSIDDIETLNLAPMVEPQNGMYLGKINDDSNISLLPNRSSSYINTIITDNDFFLYSTKENKWENYSSFFNELNIEENELNLLLND